MTASQVMRYMMLPMQVRIGLIGEIAGEKKPRLMNGAFYFMPADRAG
jgi:hypothetical protein